MRSPAPHGGCGCRSAGCSSGSRRRTPRAEAAAPRRPTSRTPPAACGWRRRSRSSPWSALPPSAPTRCPLRWRCSPFGSYRRASSGGSTSRSSAGRPRSMLRAGLLMLAGEAPQFDRIFGGLGDTLAVLRDAASDDRSDAAVRRFAALLEQGARGMPRAASDCFMSFDALHRCAMEIGAMAQADDAKRWAGALVDQCAATLGDLVRLSPDAPSARAATWDTAALTARGSALRDLAQRAGAMAEMDYGFLY